MRAIFSILNHRVSSIYLRCYRKLFPGTSSYAGEFGFECLNAIPYAYYLYKRNLLKRSYSVATMEPFYYFSKNHVEQDKKRTYIEEGYPKIPIPLGNKFDLNDTRWAPPPYKDIYKNNEFVFEKPILVISNKYTTEWDSAPCNYLKLNVLEELFILFSPKFQIIYNRYLQEDDDSEQLELGDYKFIQTHFPQVICMPDLHQSSQYSYNLLQLKVYANCSRFISVQGGGSVLASYFGGTNCIYIKKGIELISDELDHHYPRLSGCKVFYPKTARSEIQYDGCSQYNTPFIIRDIDSEFIALAKSELA